jgi:hypothetical protein
MRKAIRVNPFQKSHENTKKQLGDADMFLKEPSEEKQDQQTRDKIERWMAQVRFDRPEHVTQRSTDSPRPLSMLDVFGTFIQQQQEPGLDGGVAASSQSGEPSSAVPPSRDFLSAAQVEMQKNHVQMQKNLARVNALHARTQNLRGVPNEIIPEHAARALQAVERARKSAECSHTLRDVESRERSWGSTAGDAYVDFIFHAQQISYELDNLRLMSRFCKKP